MQNTRLNSIANVLAGRLWRWTGNSWRRISLFFVSLSAGLWFASFAITSTGQTAQWDAESAFLAVLGVEVISIYVYRTANQRQDFAQILPRRLLAIDMLNAFKVGFTYGMFIDAFKLGS